ncbi:unnamed protein product, partial [Symbiodinium sp. KB8]
VKPWASQSVETLTDEKILSEPPVDKWPGVKAVCESPEFAPFKGMLEACTEISKLIVKVKGKTASVKELAAPTDLLPAWSKCIEADESDDMATVLVDTFNKLGAAIGEVRDDLSEGFILGACKHVGKTLHSLLAGEAVSSCIEEMEKMKLWVASLPDEDARQESMAKTITFGDALI